MKRRQHNEKKKTMKEKVLNARSEEERNRLLQAWWKELQEVPADDDSRDDEIADAVLARADLSFNAYCEGYAKAEQAALSHLATCALGEAAWHKAQGASSSEAEESIRELWQRDQLTSSDISKAIAEVKQAGLWPWGWVH